MSERSDGKYVVSPKKESQKKKNILQKSKLENLGKNLKAL